MSYRIAIAGKGGTGKTTVSALMVARLIAQGYGPVLAVDADPNTCLDQALGVEADHTVGRVREDARAISQSGSSQGISKTELLELKIAESLVESDDFDLIAMGRSEGPGCYCYANNVLKAVLSKIADAYPYMVIDNEAGLENLSRRIVQDVDLLMLISDPSMAGLRTLKRLAELAADMEVSWGNLAVVVNRNRSDEVPEEAQRIVNDVEADHLVLLPNDPAIAEHAENGIPIADVEASNPVVKSIDNLIEKTVEKTLTQ
jgi:CO dehydrogenase maturation factor